MTKDTKNTKEAASAKNAEIEALLAELAAAKAELAQEAAKAAELAHALEAAKRTRKSKSSARPAHVEFLKSAPARAALAIAATGKAATALVPAYLATTLLAQGSHATGAARQVACQVSRGVAYTGGVLPELFPAAIAERFDSLKSDIQLVAGWIELCGLRDDANIIPKEYLQALADAPETAGSLYANILNNLRLEALAVQKKAFTPEDFAKIEADSRGIAPWDFESWVVPSE